MAMPTIDRLDDLAALVASGADDVYVRWSEGPDVDLAGDSAGEQSSRDALTGVPLPGLSANPLVVEPWWGRRPVRLWVARRLHDYRHLREIHGPRVRPWVLEGDIRGRGPDNEPLVACRRPIAWIADTVLKECEDVMARHATAADWGPLDRRTD
jgi:hypothetical protein